MRIIPARYHRIVGVESNSGLIVPHRGAWEDGRLQATPRGLQPKPDALAPQKTRTCSAPQVPHLGISKLAHKPKGVGGAYGAPKDQLVVSAGVRTEKTVPLVRGCSHTASPL
jgi:hypothetical protein